MADLMVHHRGLPELFRELARRLQEVVDVQLLGFSLHNDQRNVMELYLWEGEGAQLFPREIPVGESASGWVWEHQEPLLIRDLQEDDRFPAVLDVLREKGYRTYYMMPPTTAQKRLGALGVASHKADAYGAEDERLLPRIAELAALAVENALTRDAVAEEKRRLQALVDINRTLVSSLEMQNLLPLISECVTRVVPHDFAGVTVYEGDKQAMRAYVLSPAESKSVVETGRTVSLEQTLSAEAFLEERPKTLTRDDLRVSRTAIAGRVLDAGIQTVLCVPLLTSKGAVGTLNVGSRKDSAFSAQDQELLNQVAAQLAIALDNARAYREIAALKDRLAEEKLYLEDEIRTELNFEEIVGESPALTHTLTQAKTVWKVSYLATRRARSRERSARRLAVWS
jgi:formate hydrogenlyase transcriptional activator